MSSAGDIRSQVEHEQARRTRLSVPAFAGGFLYVLSAIIINQTLSGAPTVGLLQGLAPALSGVANPTVSPRTPEVKFISAHSFPLIAGSTIAAIGIAALTLVLLVLIDAVRFRRPETWRFARPLVIYGGAAVAIVSVGHQVVSALETHSFSSGHNFTSSAVEHAISTGTANEVVDFVDLISGLALAAGMIATMLGALRTGLLQRWMGILGIFSGLLIFLPIGGAELQVVPALWIVMMGVLFAGRWPNGAEPPAWAAGEARPWPSQAQMRAERRAGGNGAIPATAGAGLTPAPTQPPQAGTSRKRRKRGRTTD
jgi:hypothetical protein